MRLRRGGSFDDLFPHIGQSLAPFSSQNMAKQSLQALWEHGRIAGSLKMSLHTEQFKSSARNDLLNAIMSTNALGLGSQSDFKDFFPGN